MYPLILNTKYIVLNMGLKILFFQGRLRGMVSQKICKMLNTGVSRMALFKINMLN